MKYRLFFFFFNDTATTEIYTLSLHDALPISRPGPATLHPTTPGPVARGPVLLAPLRPNPPPRSGTWPPALSAARILPRVRHPRSKWSSSFSFPYFVTSLLLCFFHRDRKSVV